MRTNKRNSNIEILRIISMFLIVLGHFAWQTKWSFSPNDSIVHVASVHSLWIGGKLGVNIFVLISGYFLIKSNFKVKSFVSVWLTSYFYAWIIFILYSFFIVHDLSLKDLIKTIFMGSAGYLNWFVTAYLIMYVLHPFLNKLILSLKRRELLSLILLSVLIFSIFETIFKNPSIGTTGDDAIWLIIVYFIGAFIRLNEKRLIEITNLNLFLFLGLSLALSISTVFALDYVNLIKNISNSSYFYGKFIGGTSPLQLVSAICIFIIFIKRAPVQIKWVNSVARTTFAIYLIHANTLIVNWFWNDIVRAQRFQDTSFVFVYAIVITIGVFVSCSAIDMVRTKVMTRVDFKLISLISDFLEKCHTKLMSRIESFMDG